MYRNANRVLTIMLAIIIAGFTTFGLMACSAKDATADESVTVVIHYPGGGNMDYDHVTDFKYIDSNKISFSYKNGAMHEVYIGGGMVEVIK